MEYYEAHKVKMFVLTELLADIISSDASTVDEHKDQIWVSESYNTGTLHTVSAQLRSDACEYLYVYTLLNF